MTFDEYDVVRIKALILSDDERGTMGSEHIKRNPIIGDIGTIVHVHDRIIGKPEAFIVECSNKEGYAFWVSTFIIDELELIEKYKE